MTQRVYRSIGEDVRGDLPFAERWEGADRGLITCWEVGRRLSEEKPELAEHARRGELPKLGWKGGVPDPPPGKKWKYGTLSYLAQWQGLRGDDLDIDLSEEKEIVCSRTGVKVTFTGDRDKVLRSEG